MNLDGLKLAVNFKIVTDYNYGVKISFLVSKDVLDVPIIGYNVIEKITQNSVDNIEQPPYLDVLSSSFVGVNRGNIEALVDFIRAEKPILNYQKLRLQRKTRSSPIINLFVSRVMLVLVLQQKECLVLFKSNPKWPWLDGLEVPETLRTVSTGSRVNIQVNNPTKHPNFWRKRTVLG